jgi:hypothetical protein
MAATTAVMVNLRTTVPFQAMIPGAATSSSVLRE